MTPHAKTNNKMADRIPTQKPFWINDDGTEAEVVYTPIDPNKDFSIISFIDNFDNAEGFRDADKAGLSQILFGDDRLEGVSDREVGSFRKNFSRKFVQENMNGYVANNAGNLINLVNVVDSGQVERHLLGKNRNATTSTFRVGIPTGATDEQRTAAEGYNGACDAVDAYHAEIAEMEEKGEAAYVNERLDNVTDMQMAVIMAATGSMPGDPSKIARAYKNFHTATALEAVAAIGVATYTATNHATAKRLEEGHKAATQQLEANVEATLQNLGVGATRAQTAEVYRTEAAQKEALAAGFQHAETDAGYIFKDLAGKANEAGTEYLAAAEPIETP